MGEKLGSGGAGGGAVTWFKSVPIWAWMCLGLVLLCGWQQVELAGVRAEFAEYQRDVAEAGRLAEAAEREKERQWNAKIAEIEKDGQTQIRDLSADERAAVAALERMRRRADEAAARSTACGNTLTAQLGASAGGAGALPADLLERLGELARLYALEADKRGIAGRTCEAAYNALKPP